MQKLKFSVVNNCPYAGKEILYAFNMLKMRMQQTRTIREYFVNLYKALKLRLRTQTALDDHRRGGHARYSPDCPECKRGAATHKSHERLFTCQGGELNVDIRGPYAEGIPVIDRVVARHQWPRYLLVGTFVPFGDKEAKARYEQ